VWVDQSVENAHCLSKQLDYSGQSRLFDQSRVVPLVMGPGGWPGVTDGVVKFDRADPRAGVVRTRVLGRAQGLHRTTVGAGDTAPRLPPLLACLRACWAGVSGGRLEGSRSGSLRQTARLPGRRQCLFGAPRVSDRVTLESLTGGLRAR